MLSIIRIQYISNIRGNTSTFKSYNISNGDNTLQYLHPRQDSVLPQNSFFFPDEFKLKKSDFKGISKGDLLITLSNIAKYNGFANFARIAKRGLYPGKLSPRQIWPIPPNRTPSLHDPTDKIVRHNVNLYLEQLFKQGDTFYLTNKNKPYTVMHYNLLNEELPDVSYINHNNQDFIEYTVRVHLDLEDEKPSKVSKKQKKKASCHGRREKISILCNQLNGCKSILDFYRGPRGYIPRARKIVNPTLTPGLTGSTSLTTIPYNRPPPYHYPHRYTRRRGGKKKQKTKKKKKCYATHGVSQNKVILYEKESDVNEYVRSGCIWKEMKRNIISKPLHKSTCMLFCKKKDCGKQTKTNKKKKIRNKTRRQKKK
jgi:hypothetical protein